MSGGRGRDQQPVRSALSAPLPLRPWLQWKACTRHSTAYAGAALSKYPGFYGMFALVLRVITYCRAKEKRRMSPQALPNFLLQITNF